MTRGPRPAGPAAGPELDLNEAVLALSDALDLVGVQIVQHGKRVAFMATETARELSLPEEDVSDLFLACLLHDCGVSSTSAHRRLVGELDWEEAGSHCVEGERLLRPFPPFERLARIVRLHHTHWNAPELAAAPRDVALLANLVFLADRVDAFLARTKERDVLLARDEVRGAVGALAGTFFSPDLVEAFLHASAPEAFWLTLEPHHLDRWLDEAARHARKRTAPPGSLRRLAGIFARIVDAKSRFTAEHSEGVARLAALLGRLAGLPAETCEELEIAGLLHDLGKLRVPDEILEKTSRLDATEFAAVERHTFETYQILRRIAPLKDVATWAAFHHESLSGRGYPFHARGSEIPLPARLIAVADVFQALAQDRPYRSPMVPTEILGQLREMAAGGKLDGWAVGLVSQHLMECWSAATGTTTAPG